MSNEKRTRPDSKENLLPEILQTLRSAEQTKDFQLQENALERFQTLFARKGQFSRENEHEKCLEILKFLLKKKFANASSNVQLSPIFFACLRILLRDESFVLIFVHENGLIGLKKQIDFYLRDLQENLCDKVSITLKVFGNLLNILQKIFSKTSADGIQEYIRSSDLIRSLTNLLFHHREFSLIRDTLKIIIPMIEQSEFYVHDYLQAEILDILYDLLNYEDLETTQFSLQLLANLLHHPETQQSIQLMCNDFIQLLTRFLSRTNSKVVYYAVWCLISLSNDDENRQKIRLTGAIPLLLSLLKNVSAQVDQWYDVHNACCRCLTELSYNQTNGQTIIEQNGIYILASLLFPENENEIRNERFRQRQKNAFQTLRFLFASNKKYEQYQFKRLFSADIFELFIGIGNFQRDLELYENIVQLWNSKSFDELNKIKNERLETINPRQEPVRFIQDYAVYECLGSGAFGSVYRVAKRGSTNMYALKEIDHRSLRKDPNRSLGQMINEVNIIRAQLQHPNIVNYREIFIENDQLYIRMELINGSSLNDYLTFLKDSQRKMNETKIWRVFIQLVLALKYLHKEKNIVHRDLSANNIMIDDEYRVKITDFGLAKLREEGAEKMTSFVGAINYACPEIVQHLPYNEKADIWSLGCILYHMVALVPPFYTSNLLALVEKICTSSFDRTPLDFYSERIRQIIVQCLTIDTNIRPDIYGVVQMCIEQLMTYTDGVCTTVQVLTHRLRQRHHQRETETMRQTIQFQSSRCSFCSSSNGRIGEENVDDAEETPRERIRFEFLSKQSSFLLFSGVDSELLDQSRSSMIENSSIENGSDSIRHSMSASSTETRLSIPTPTRRSSLIGSVSVSSHRLRHTDPISQLLDVVHKLIYLSYVHFVTTTNERNRRWIDRYRTYLFYKSSSKHLKRELHKLSTHSSDLICFGKDFLLSETEESISYEQMMTLIEQILKETNYSKDFASSTKK